MNKVETFEIDQEDATQYTHDTALTAIEIMNQHIARAIANSPSADDVPMEVDDGGLGAVDSDLDDEFAETIVRDENGHVCVTRPWRSVNQVSVACRRTVDSSPQDLSRLVEWSKQQQAAVRAAEFAIKQARIHVSQDPYKGTVKESQDKTKIIVDVSPNHGSQQILHPASAAEDEALYADVDVSDDSVFGDLT